MSAESRSDDRRNTVLVGIAAALVLVALTAYRLDRAGAFYDELHQATGAFAYVGRPTTLFSFVPIAGVPLLNMSYTGAIKTAIYGLYLRATGLPFSLFSWRLLGILFSAVALIVFSLLTAGRLPLSAIALFFALLLTDTNLLLQSRHDWGPAALAFLIRMILVGLAVRQFTESRGRWGPFLLGVIVGVAIFEKLSSAILVGALAAMVFTDPRTRSVRSAAQAAAGIAVGALPVIVVNAYSLLTSGTLIALSSVDMTPRRSLFGYAVNYLALGNGGIERRMIFETPSYRWTEALESLAILVLLAIVAFAAWKRGPSSRPFRLAGMMLLCYAAVGAALPLLPHGTAEHHWIVGTPFQYLAMALATVELWRADVRWKAGRGLAAACLIALLTARLPTVAAVVEGIRGDEYTRAWDPSLNAAAEFTARQPRSAIVIAANWGIGTQILCFANGRQNFLFELYPGYGGPETLNPVLAPPVRQIVIAAALKPEAPLKPGEINTLRQQTAAIFRDLAEAPGWKEIPVDPSMRDLRAVEIRMFERVKGAGAL